jgi:hypothetical protein
MKIVVDKYIRASDEDKQRMIEDTERAFKRLETLDPLSMKAFYNSFQHTGNKDTFVLCEPYHCPDPSQGIPLKRDLISKEYDPDHNYLLGWVRQKTIETALKGLDKENSSTANARSVLNNVLNKVLERIPESEGDLKAALSHASSMGILPGHYHQSIMNASYNDLKSLYGRYIKDNNTAKSFIMQMQEFAGKIMGNIAARLPYKPLANINPLSLQDNEHGILECLNYLARIPSKNDRV